MTDIQQQLRQHIAALPGEQVKAALQRWVEMSALEVEDLEQQLADEQEALQAHDDVIASEEYRSVFPFLTQEQKIQRSLEAHAEYEQVGGKSHAAIRAWADNLPR